VVTDPAALRRRLLEAGAGPGFQGIMVDRRYDRDGTLLTRDEVLRLREFRSDGALPRFFLSWKGPTVVTPEGYKSRRELEFELRPRADAPAGLLELLGYHEVQRIDRYVEYYRLGEADIRLEWYPRMDVLAEVEGEEAALEGALGQLGIPRECWLPDSLPAFAARFAARTGAPAALALSELGSALPCWESR
jgi:adenylate cyclase class IV